MELMVPKGVENKIYTIAKDRETSTAATQSQSPAAMNSNMLIKRSSVGSKYYISDPLMVSNDTKGHETKIYNIVTDRWNVIRVKGMSLLGILFAYLEF